MPIALALLDLVPVLLTALGLRLVARLIRDGDPTLGRWAGIGAALVVAGGLGKAGSKVILAVGGPEVPLLAAMLYPGLALGYLLIVASLAAAGRPPRPRWSGPWLPAAVALVPLVAVTLAVGPGGGRIAPLAWLVTGGIASMVLDALLAGRARRSGRPVVAGLLVGHLGSTLALQALAGPADQSIELQWVQELLNSATQAAFLVAVTRLWSSRRPEPVSHTLPA